MKTIFLESTTGVTLVLKQEMTRKKIVVSEMETLCGVSRQTITNHINGKTPLTLDALIKYFSSIGYKLALTIAEKENENGTKRITKNDRRTNSIYQKK